MVSPVKKRRGRPPKNRASPQSASASDSKPNSRSGSSRRKLKKLKKKILAEKQHLSDLDDEGSLSNRSSNPPSIDGSSFNVAQQRLETPTGMSVSYSDLEICENTTAQIEKEIETRLNDGCGNNQLPARLVENQYVRADDEADDREKNMEESTTRKLRTYLMNYETGEIRENAQAEIGDKDVENLNTESPLNNQKMQRPWTDIVTGNRVPRQENKMEFIAPDFKDGEMEIVIEEEDVQEELQFWKTGLIIFAVGGNLTMTAVRNFMAKVWN